MAGAPGFVETAHPRAVDGTFAAKQRGEVDGLDLDNLGDPSAPDLSDSTTWARYGFPDEATYEDLPDLIEGYHGLDHYRLPEVVGARFSLVHNLDLSKIGAPREPSDYAQEWDDDEGEDDAEDRVADYEDLCEAMETAPWDVAPVVVIAWGDDLDEALAAGEYELLDGNHRAGLGLGAGIKQHPGYVLLCTSEDPEASDTVPAAHRSRPASEMMADYAPTDGMDWGSLRDEYETEHPVVMAALREDMSVHGMKTPVVVRDGRVENGQHRILVAADLGIAVTWREWTPADSDSSAKRYWDPKTREHYGPDEDEYDEGQPRY